MYSKVTIEVVIMIINFDPLLKKRYKRDEFSTISSVSSKSMVGLEKRKFSARGYFSDWLR